MWRVPGAILLILSLGGPAAAADARVSDRACLSSGDMAEAVASHGVIAPSDAMSMARGAIEDSEILRLSLCREADRLVYRITALRRDGRVVRVTVDAPSGKVKAVQ